MCTKSFRIVQSEKLDDLTFIVEDSQYGSDGIVIVMPGIDPNALLDPEWVAEAIHARLRLLD